MTYMASLNFTSWLRLPFSNFIHLFSYKILVKKNCKELSSKLVLWVSWVTTTRRVNGANMKGMEVGEIYLHTNLHSYVDKMNRSDPIFLLSQFVYFNILYIYYLSNFSSIVLARWGPCIEGFIINILLIRM